MKTKRRLGLPLLCFFLLIGIGTNTVDAQSVQVHAAVEKTEVFLGEPFIFQIQIEGSDDPGQPNLGNIDGFSIHERGGQNNSSSSVTIINGRMVQNVSRGFVFSYQLTPLKKGVVTIPSIPITANGQTFRTQAIPIRVNEPAETDDFKLRMELSSNEVYVGQAVTLTVTWYIGKDVEEFHFSTPVLLDPLFVNADSELSIDSTQKDRYLRIPLQGGEVIGEKTQEMMGGKEYLTVRFQKILIPQKSGSVSLPQSTVSFNAVMGYQKRRQRSPFDDFFKDDFFGRRQANKQKFVIPSNQPSLNVLPLPEEGKPDTFTGLIGEYHLTAHASFSEVRVGDPITLTIEVSGPEYLDNVELPPLHLQPTLIHDFKIPAEMSPGKVEGGVKTFTQTFRAKHPDVTAIPPIELSYFDVKQKKYATARSEPIPLSVSATRVVTVQDAEGTQVTEEVKSELESFASGIAHNYEDLSVLENHAYGPAMWISSPLWLSLLGGPPTLFLMLLFLSDHYE